MKPSAEEINTDVRELLRKRGDLLEFESRPEAERLARRLSKPGEQVRIQKSAPQDPNDVDGYLISNPKRYTNEPKDTPDAGLTFDVEANQYGALGEALIRGSAGVSPALRYFLYEETDVADDRTHRLRGIQDPYIPEEFGRRVAWKPDYLVQIRRRSDGQIEKMYFCEVKTGDASFQRRQRKDMKVVAEEFGVLKIRVDIDGLPDEYTVRISKVSPDP